MPAKAVVFNSIRKHDGNQFRVLEPGEYTQVSHSPYFDVVMKVGDLVVVVVYCPSSFSF